MNLLRWIVSGVLVVHSLGVFAQEGPRRKPVLIREDRTTEPDAEPEVILPDPFEARRNIDVGDFYFKRKNYKAAAERYRDAVKYGPSLTDSYDKLIRALERMEAYSDAAEVCREFIDKNPESNLVADFEKRERKLLGRVKSG